MDGQEYTYIASLNELKLEIQYYFGKQLSKPTRLNYLCKHWYILHVFYLFLNFIHSLDTIDGYIVYITPKLGNNSEGNRIGREERDFRYFVYRDKRSKFYIIQLKAQGN